MTMLCRPSRSENLALFVFRVSPLASVRGQGRPRRLLKLFSIWKQLTLMPILIMKLSQNCRPSKNVVIYTKIEEAVYILIANLRTAFSLAFFIFSSTLEWDWMSNGPLQSYSMAAFTYSRPAVSHDLLLCGQV